jgi:hypothetical protein
MIEDQVALFRSYASREGLDIVEVHEDRARSGGSIKGRAGLLRLRTSYRSPSAIRQTRFLDYATVATIAGSPSISSVEESGRRFRRNR